MPETQLLQGDCLDVMRGTQPATPVPSFPAELKRIAIRLDAIEEALADYPTFAPVRLAEALARETRRLAAMLESREAGRG